VCTSQSLEPQITIVQNINEHDISGLQKDEKIVCRYPQYYAARTLYENIKKAEKPEGGGKGGTYFGATGSKCSLFISRRAR
jgi:hypothetical protein